MTISSCRRIVIGITHLATEPDAIASTVRHATEPLTQGKNNSPLLLCENLSSGPIGSRLIF